MLQWNARLFFVLALVVAVAAVFGMSSGDEIQFGW